MDGYGNDRNLDCGISEYHQRGYQRSTCTSPRSIPLKGCRHIDAGEGEPAGTNRHHRKIISVFSKACTRFNSIVILFFHKAIERVTGYNEREVVCNEHCPDT